MPYGRRAEVVEAYLRQGLARRLPLDARRAGGQHVDHQQHGDAVLLLHEREARADAHALERLEEVVAERLLGHRVRRGRRAERVLQLRAVAAVLRVEVQQHRVVPLQHVARAGPDRARTGLHHGERLLVLERGRGAARARDLQRRLRCRWTSAPGRPPPASDAGAHAVVTTTVVAASAPTMTRNQELTRRFSHDATAPPERQRLQNEGALGPTLWPVPGHSPVVTCSRSGAPPGRRRS